MRRSYSCRISYNNEELKLTVNGIEYTVNVHATGSYSYQPCVMYFKDGTGQPEDWDWEVEDIEAKWFLNGNQVEPTDEMTGELEDYMYDLDLDEWVFPQEPEEPDYEDW